MQTENLQEVLAMATIGDGIIALTWPRRHMRLWNIGPRPYRRFMDRLETKPDLVRCMGAAEVALGLFWASRLLQNVPARTNGSEFRYNVPET